MFTDEIHFWIDLSSTQTANCTHQVVICVRKERNTNTLAGYKERGNSCVCLQQGKRVQMELVLTPGLILVDYFTSQLLVNY